MDLLALVLRRARRRRAPSLPDRAVLRGLNGQWRTAEYGVMDHGRGRPVRLERMVREFHRLARASGEREALGRAARLKGTALGERGRFAESLPAYREAAELLRGTARDAARLGMAGALLRLGRFHEAVEVCRAVRRAARRRGEAGLAGAALLNQAVAVHESGEPAAAVPLYRKARSELAAGGAPAYAAVATQNLANALVLIDRFAEAGHSFKS